MWLHCGLKLICTNMVNNIYDNVLNKKYLWCHVTHDGGSYYERDRRTSSYVMIWRGIEWMTFINQQGQGWQTLPPAMVLLRCYWQYLRYQLRMRSRTSPTAPATLGVNLNSILYNCDLVPKQIPNQLNWRWSARTSFSVQVPHSEWNDSTRAWTIPQSHTDASGFYQTFVNKSSCGYSLSTVPCNTSCETTSTPTFCVS